MGCSGTLFVLYRTRSCCCGKPTTRKRTRRKKLQFDFMDRLLWFTKRRDATATDESATGAESCGNYPNRIVPIWSDDVALKIAAFNRAVTIRANTMSQLLIQYQRKAGNDGHYIEDTRGENGKLNYLLQIRPNAMMTAAALMQQAEVEIMLHGNAFIFMERHGGMWPEAFWLATGIYNMDGTYSLTYNTPNGVKAVNADMSDVLHIANTFRDSTGIVGISVLDHARDALSLSATENREALQNAGKGGKMKLFISQEKKSQMGVMQNGLINKNQLKQAAQQLNEDIYKYDVVAMPRVTNVTPFSMNAEQMQLLQSRAFSVNDIARFTGVPSFLLMDSSNSSYRTPSEATQELLVRTIQPKIREWEDELFAKLLLPDDFGKRRFHVCERPLLRLDAKSQAEIDKIHLETGVKTVNELRSDHDMSNVEGGDKNYISTNLAELGSEKLSGGTPPKTEKGGEDDNNA